MRKSNTRPGVAGATAVQLIFNPFSQFASQLELYSQLQLNLWSDPIAFSVPKSTLLVIHCQFGFTSTRTSLNRPFGLRPFGRPCTVDLDASNYTNMYCSFGQNLAIQMDALTPCIWTIQIHVRGPSIWTTLERIIGWSKYTLNDCPNGRSGDVQLDGPNIRSLRPNVRRSNGPSI